MYAWFNEFYDFADKFFDNQAFRIISCNIKIT